MRNSLRECLRHCKTELRRMSSYRDKWVKDWQSQPGITSSQIQWTSDCTKVLLQCKWEREKKNTFYSEYYSIAANSISILWWIYFFSPYNIFYPSQFCQGKKALKVIFLSDLKLDFIISKRRYQTKHRAPMKTRWRWKVPEAIKYIFWRLVI